MSKEKSRGSIFFRYLKRYYRYWIIGLVTIILTTSMAVMIPLLIKRAIDSLEQGSDLNTILYQALLIVGITALAGFFRFLTRQTVIVSSRKIEYEIRNDFFSHLETLDRKFYENTPTGDIMSRATNDLEAVRAMYGPGLMHSTSTFFTVVMAFILMYRVDPVLTSYAFVVLPLLSVSVLILGKKVHKHYRRIQEHYGKISAYVQENLSGIKVVTSFVQQDNQIAGFEDLNKDYIKKNMDMVKVWGMFFPVLSMIAGFVTVLIIIVGGKRVIDGEASLGSFVAFIAYVEMLIWPMIALGWVIGIFQRGLASLGRMREVFDREPIIASLPETLKSEKVKGGIEFRDLSFSFRDNSSKPVLRNISFKIEPGQTVAIVGATGSGKSALVSLIPRLYPVPDGKIFVDGKDINKFDLENLRSNIGFIPQDNFLFSTSITNNINFYSARDINRDDIERAADTADFLKDIEEFPHGFDTVLGEKGITLSGGQKQRASIARAIALKPPILIFDDAFSSVDTHTEERILNNLRGVLEARTVLLISHRISTVKNADFIMVLEDGRLVETGSHEELLSRGGIYAQIHQKQLLIEQLAAY